MRDNEEAFKSDCKDSIDHVLRFLKMRYNFNEYRTYRGTFLSSYPEELQLIRDRLDVYCRMYTRPEKYKDKELWFIGNVNHLVNNLLKYHPVRWYHFGSFKRDLISYRNELESILQYNQNLKALPGEK